MKSAKNTQVESNYAPPCKGRGKGVGLLSHFLKIALRGMLRFKLQTMVCVTGLAVGMTCFALGTLWLRFIESFEDFVPKAEDVYLAIDERDEATGGVEYMTGYTLGQALLDDHAELKAHCTLGQSTAYWVKSPLVEKKSFAVEWADTSFFRMFGIKPLEGSLAHLNEREVVLTETFARRFFGTEKAVGQTLEMGCLMSVRPEDYGVMQPHTVVAVVADLPQNTQFGYNIITPIPSTMSDTKNGYGRMFYTFVRKHPAARLDSLLAKPFVVREDVPMIREDVFGDDLISTRVHKVQLLPIRSLRTDHPRQAATIQTNYVRWFVMLGVLVIACALCNYLITMVTRIRIREREIALRRVNGASRASILVMLGVETLLLFLLSGAIGWLLTWLLIPSFREYSGILLPLSDIALEVWLYLLAVTAVGLVSTTLTAIFVMRHLAPLPAPPRGRAVSFFTRSGIYTPPRGSGEGGFGVALQLALAMGIIFSATVIMSQIHYICYSGEMGFDVNRAIKLNYATESIKQRFLQSPLVGEMVESPVVSFPCANLEACGFYADSTLANDTRDFEQLHYVKGRISAYQLPIDTALARFFGYQLVAGRLPMPGDLLSDKARSDRVLRGEVFNECSINEVCITENVARALGLKDPVGRKLFGDFGWENYIVVGVLKDLYLTGATKEPDRYILKHTDHLRREVVMGGEAVTHYYLRASQGKDQELRDSIKAWRTQLEQQHVYLLTEDVDATFQKYITSERLLLNILWAVALASMFVCTVGAFSLISLSLEERRKEIAIRKVHGARLPDILKLFLRSNVISICVAAAIAYPIAYLLMRHWLEGYSKQVPIGWWLIPLTFLSIAAIVLSTITLKIWRAAKESTVEALK